MNMCEPELDMSDDYMDDSEKYNRIVKKAGSLEGGAYKAN